MTDRKTTAFKLLAECGHTGAPEIPLLAERVANKAAERISELEAKILRLESRGIEDMQGRIVELEAQQQWVPVSERLPDNGDQVLVKIGGGSVQPSFYDLDAATEFDYYDVTHWMAFPAPPQEEI